MYILRDVLADGEYQAPNADVAWFNFLRPRPHAPTLVWLVTTGDQCAQAAEQAELCAELVVLQEGATPQYYRASGYSSATGPAHGAARAGGPTRRQTAAGRTSTLGPSVALGGD